MTDEKFEKLSLNFKEYLECASAELMKEIKQIPSPMYTKENLVSFVIRLKEVESIKAMFDCYVSAIRKHDSREEKQKGEK